MREARSDRRLAAQLALPAPRRACGGLRSCGEESRPYALIFGREPPRCYRCDRIAQGRPPYELNHVFGKRNSDLTIRYPINDHRAVLSVAQLPLAARRPGES